MAAVVVLVLLLGASQLFRSLGATQPATASQAEQSASSQQDAHVQQDQTQAAPNAQEAASGQGPSPAPESPTATTPAPAVQAADAQHSPALAPPDPRKLVPEGAPLHERGRDYELEALIDAQKQWAASQDLAARDAWFQRGATTEWNYEPNGRKTIYLTFDDGPSVLTPQILDILDRYGAKATFFVTATYPEYQDYIKIAYDAGHTIALHTGTHDYSYAYASEYCYFEDLGIVADLVESQIGYVPAFIRFPGGSSNSISANITPGIMSVLVNSVQGAGYQYYDWNSANNDAFGGVAPTEEIIAAACSYTDENLIMLMHDSENKTTTVEALPAIIEHFLREGYRFEPITPDTMVYHHGVVN